ncbi:MAG: cytochrome c biogenesis protein CcsA [Gammaproteobacteria bacterium]|nr:cytochrome c biogenesis protein CcsA [Gammaproteobacteria bacterium]RZV52374.1 MAG: inner membrane protein YpjD [Pseudomonadales bacterium]
MPHSTTAALALACFAALAYVAATAPLLANRSSGVPGRRPLLIGALAALLHAAVVVSDWFAHGGLSSSFFDAVSLTALIVVVVTLLYQYSQRLAALLAPVYISAAICVALAAGFGHYSPINAESPGMLTHVITAITGYGLLCLAALYALVLSSAERGLRKGRQGPWLSALPALDSLEQHLFSLLLATWLTIGVSIVTGMLYVDNLLQQHLLHKTVFTLVSWITLAALLLGRHFYGWRGRTAVRWTLIAFVLLALGFLGSKFVLDVVLNRV